MEAEQAGWSADEAYAAERTALIATITQVSPPCTYAMFMFCARHTMYTYYALSNCHIFTLFFTLSILHSANTNTVGVNPAVQSLVEVAGKLVTVKDNLEVRCALA